MSLLRAIFRLRRGTNSARRWHVHALDLTSFFPFVLFMKTTLFLASILLSLAACSSADKPDPRIAAIQQQHQEILAKQKASAVQESTPELTGNGRADDAKKNLADIVQQSHANLTALDQLDAGKSQEPAQVAVVSDVATKETELLQRATTTVELNERMIVQAKKKAQALDSINAEIDADKAKALRK
jgi:hypothetical protein